MAKLKLPFELEKPSSNEYVTQSSQIGHNGQPLDDVLEGLDNISKESTQSEEQALVFETDGGVQVGKIDANGADFANLKRGGQQVARMSDLPTVPTISTDISADASSNTKTASPKAVKDYVDAHQIDLPITEEATQSETEEMEFGNDAGTQPYAKVGSYGMKSKAYLDMQGNSVIPTKDTSISEIPSQTNVPTSKAVADYVTEHGSGDLPITKETIIEGENKVLFTDDNDNTVVEINKDRMKVKEITDLNGNPIGGGLTHPQRRLYDFEPSFISVKRGRSNNEYGVGTGWYERLRILHISDTHAFYDLVKESIEIAQGRCHIICNTGDDANGNTPVPASTTKEVLTNTKNAITSKNTSRIPYLVTKGNHDVPNLTRAELKNIMGALVSQYATSVVWGDTQNNGMYGYYDITPNATIGTIRFVMLDCYDYPDDAYPNTRGFMTATFTQTQIDWLISTLADARTNGYKVITMMHYSFGDNSLRFNEEKAKPDATFYQDAFMIPDIIDAFQHGTALSKTYSDSKNIDNITVNISASASNLEYICHLFGHIHSKNYYQCQKTDGSKIYDILMLGEAAIGTSGNALNKAYRESSSVNAIAFSCLEIDTVEECVYRVSYGSYMNYDCSTSNKITKIPYRFNNNN